MRYFEIRQDVKLRNPVEFEGFKGCPDIVLSREDAVTFKRCSCMYVTGGPNCQYSDLYQSPVLLISEKLYQILKYYDDDVIYKIAVLTDLENRRQEIYRLMLPVTAEALGSKTAYQKNGQIERPVILADAGCHNRIFYVSEGITHHLIVTGDVLESILARDCVGISYEELETEGLPPDKGEGKQ